MSEFTGKLQGKRSTDSTVSIVADADSSKIEIGENKLFEVDGINSVLRVRNKDGKEAIGLNGGANVMAVFDANEKRFFEVDGRQHELRIWDGLGNRTIELSGEAAILSLGKEKQAISLNAVSSLISIFDEKGFNIFEVDAKNSTLRMRNKNNNRALEVDGINSVLRMFDKNGKEAIGVNGGANTLDIFNPNGNKAVGLNGQDNALAVFNKSGNTAINLNGGANAMAVFNESGNMTLHFDGNSGDIELLNADCAEEFDVLPQETVEPGTVMVINDSGSLEPNSKAYDKRVAGIISGAGGLKPGIVLDKQKQSYKNEKRLPIALMGKVYCKVDATVVGIEVGDLLTTSQTQGHAMKVTDHAKALGAIIGKALKPLREGRGMIPVLVALQ